MWKKRIIFSNECYVSIRDTSALMRRALDFDIDGSVMSLPKAFKTQHCIAICAIVLFLLQSGCAQIRLPAIDPTGRGIFLPAPYSNQLLGPNSAAQTGNPLRNNPGFNPAFQPPGFGVNPAANPNINPQTVPFGPATNQPVQPAFQNPPTPPPCDGTGVNRTVKKTILPDPNRIKTRGQDGQIIMTPSRIVAPVGSEVVVLAGICGGDGFFVKNQPLEWMLSNNSVGELVEIGGTHHSSFNRLIPPTAKKFSGQYAWGRTGLKNIVLTRGTPTPVDDIELAKGQTFVSVSSASPGTSYITAVAPKAEGWDKRRASTIIHWVDGQWSVPVPTRATAGTVHPLTTVVSRTADGSGIKNWEVRYAIVGGAPAEFAPSGSQTAEAKTNNDGQATVQIRQPAGRFEPGTTQVRVDIVRPPVFGEQELVVESGITSVTWSAPALSIRAVGPRKAEFDEPFNYRIEVANPGDQVATGVVVRTKNLDDGIEFISSTPKPTEYGRQFEWQLGDIAPNSPPRIIDVQLKSKKRGNVGMCFEVASESDGLSTEACAETEIILPCIGFASDGPATVRVGDKVPFGFNLENQCDEALEDVVVQIAYDPGLIRPGSSNPVSFRVNPGQLLQPGETASEQIIFDAIAAGSQCINITISARGVQSQAEQRCVEVIAKDGSGSILNGGTPGSNQDSPLKITLSGGEPVEVGQAMTVRAQITNTGSTPIERVTLVNAYASTYSADSITQEFVPGTRAEGNEIFVDVGTINPNETVTIDVQYDANQVDPDAGVEFTAISRSGASAVDSLLIPIQPAGSLGGQGGGGQPGTGGQASPGIGMPDFGGSGDGSISIPNNGAGQGGQPNGGANAGANQGELQVRVQTVDKNIRVGQPARIRFSVTNNTSRAINGVKVGVIIPNSLTNVQVTGSDNNLKLIKQFEFEPIQTLRDGGTYTFDIVADGRIPGMATIEVLATSEDTFGRSSATDSLSISQ
ncbi:MAG: hypothetical protein AB8B55_14720 [Mariniblastus sp.]